MEGPTSAEKLTDREKECLRRWLEHKTAKEIALELGVSHHAVEKRLKMARTKLGVATSLEAARLLAEAEGYGPTVAQPPDLPNHQIQSNRWGPQPLILGAISMTLCTALALVLFSQSAPSTTFVEAVAPEEDRLAAMTRRTFDGLDDNKSGFLEDPESPFMKTVFLEKGGLVDESLAIALTKEARETPDPEKSAQFYAEADRDGDGRISYAEYHDWSVPRIASLGLDLLEALKPES